MRFTWLLMFALTACPSNDAKPASSTGTGSTGNAGSAGSASALDASDPVAPNPDAVIREAIAHPPDDHAFLSYLIADGVTVSGELDGGAGRMVLAFNLIPNGSGPLPARCPVIVVSAGRREQRLAPCLGSDPILEARCTLAQIWAKAIAAGAPRERLATISVGTPPYMTAQLDEGMKRGKDAGRGWLFQSTADSGRVTFERFIADDCDAQ